MLNILLNITDRPHCNTGDQVCSPGLPNVEIDLFRRRVPISISKNDCDITITTVVLVLSDIRKNYLND